MKRREEMTFLEKLYIWEIVKGVFQTGGDLLKHFVLFLMQTVGIKAKTRPWATIEYPDDVRPYAPRYRGRHRLTLNHDGSVRCTACFLCATACPARCIYIEPAEHPDKRIEKFPKRYEIDTLLCIYCGYCVDACPVDAIRMDTGLHPQIYSGDPRTFIEDKEILMQRSRLLEDLGPEELRRRHLKQMQEVERNSDNEKKKRVV